MMLKALRVHDLRRFTGSGIAIEGIGEGLSALIAPNESGKTTLLEALEALLVFKPTSRDRAIRGLEPIGGGAPVVSADIAFGDGTFRIEKRFLSRPFVRISEPASGRIVAQADQAAAWLAERLGKAHDASPMALLWVRQGAADSLAAGRAAREAALGGIVRHEAEALGGGDRLRALRARVRAELDQLLTPGQRRVKADGPLGQAGRETAALQARCAALDGEIAALEQEFAALAAARESHARWAEPAAQAREATRLAQARTALEAAETAARRREAAETAARLAEAEALAAAQALERFDKALADVAAAAQAAQAAAGTRAAAAQAEAAALAGTASARDALAAAAADATAAAEAETAARKARQAVTDARERAALAARLERARVARTALEEARRRDAAIALRQADLDDIAALEAALRDARTRLDAARTRLAVRLGSEAGRQIRLDGRALSGDIDCPLDGPATLELGPLGTVTVTPGLSAADGTAAVEQASRALAARLAASGHDDPAAARAAMARKLAAREAAAQAEAALAALAPEGYEALAAALARLPESDDPLPEAPEASAIDARADDAQRARQTEAQCRAAAERALEAEQAARLHHAEARIRHAEALERHRAAAAQLAPEPDRIAHRERLSQAVSQKRAAADDMRRRREALAAVAAPDPDMARADVARLEAARQTRRETVARLDQEITLRSQRIAAADGVEERRAEAAEALAAAEATLARWQAHRAALERLDEALAGAEAALHERFFAPLRQALAPLLGHVFGDAAVEFDEATLGPASLARADTRIEAAALSQGAREQVALLTRLAYATLLPAATRPPVILDDALSFTDDARLDRVFGVLSRLSAELQIIVLSCHESSFAALGARPLVPQPWTPSFD